MGAMGVPRKARRARVRSYDGNRRLVAPLQAQP